MKVLTITSCAILIWLCPCDVTSDSRFKFLGIGYNLLTGNPDGGSSAMGGVDPGLLITHKIFDLSNPLAVQAESRSSCDQVEQVSVFYGDKSYQDKLRSGVSIEGGADFGIASAAFRLSTMFGEVHQQTTNDHKVFQDNQVTCNLGRQRFSDELQDGYKFPVTQNFAASVCSLPTTYDEFKYMQFLDEWGTHVTMEVELGTKHIVRYESTLASFVEHVAEMSSDDVSAGGSFMGFGGSLKVDFESFKQSSNFKRSFGVYQTTLQSGTPSVPEPIGLKIQPIDIALSPEYWNNTSLLTSNNVCTSSELAHIEAVRPNLRKAVSEYATYRQVARASLTDPALQIPLTWPKGTFGLYQSKSGCPGGGATWYTGWRKHDGEDAFNKNKWSHSLHLGGTFGHDITMKFCIKGNDQTSEFDLDWPKGDYCIAEYGSCPKGFHEGWLKWDDEDASNNNDYSGYLPKGVYNSNTKIYYCCRDDGSPTTEIDLPTDKPFYLLRHTYSSCQLVHGMNVAEEWVYWDEEDHSSGTAFTKSSSSYHPYDDGDEDNHKIHFCYYTPVSGTIVG